MLVGYGRVSTRDQNLARQGAALVLLAEPDRSLSAIAKLLKVFRTTLYKALPELLTPEQAKG
ncbi:hypothetical protein [Nonomuraea wenchangensis]|uniref:hypothetical protein n=1 Tax=Nonomuraea wenchangensis TaxID=568860 RepID=UPI00331A048A